MRGFLPIAVLVAALLQLQGCSFTPTLQRDVLKQVQGYESAQEYGKALDLLAAVPPNHPQRARLAQRKAQIEAKAHLLEQNSIRRAADLAAQNRWGDALRVYREALDKLPRSQALRNDLQQFRRRQAARVKELEVDQLVAKARWLERSLAVQQTIVATDPDDGGASRELQRLKETASDVAQELSGVGLAALDANNLALASRTLPLASRLAPNNETEHARSQLSFGEASQQKAERAAHARALESFRHQEGRKLLGELRQASRKGDLRRARLILTRLQDMDGDNPEVKSESARVESQLTAALKKHMDEGNSLYGRGKFKEAIASWNKVLELDPEHETARNSIDRAERVVEKLRQLRQEQSPGLEASAP